MTSSNQKNEPVFRDLDFSQLKPTEIESYCVKCGRNGTTKLLLTRIPHFKEVTIMSFECGYCNFRNNELQSATTIAERGCVWRCQIKSSQDLNRQLVKAESASLKYVELDLELPAGSGRGVLTTVEGMLNNTIVDLAGDQPLRKIEQPEVYTRIAQMLNTLESYVKGTEPFTLQMDDPAGHSYIESLCAPQIDPRLSITYYQRTPEQNAALGLQPLAEESETPKPVDEEEVLGFPGICASCSVPCETRMKLIGWCFPFLCAVFPFSHYFYLDIPYFKQVVIMSTTCDACGYKSSEVKASGAIAAKGRKFNLRIENMDDLSRDILKSETCAVKIPEIELELYPGTLGGKFTTIEGLLSNIRDDLVASVPFVTSGDAPVDQQRLHRFELLSQDLNKVIEGKLPCTLILDDPVANSYIQNLNAPDPDPQLTVELYDRSWEQNEILGLNDIKT